MKSRLAETIDKIYRDAGVVPEWVEQGIKQGREEGIAQGREEGREQSREEIARNALAAGISPELVSGFTGIDPETVKSWKFN